MKEYEEKIKKSLKRKKFNELLKFRTEKAIYRLNQIERLANKYVYDIDFQNVGVSLFLLKNNIRKIEEAFEKLRITKEEKEEEKEEE